MRLAPTILGLGLLIAGAWLSLYGARMIPYDVQKVEEGVLIQSTKFSLAESHVIEVRLDAGVTAVAKSTVTIPVVNEPGDVSIYVLDSSNFEKWQRRDKNVQFLASLRRDGDFNFTFSTKRDGTYHIVFDNSHSVYRKLVAFEAGYSRVVTVTEQRKDMTLNYSGAGIVIAGVAVGVYGVRKDAPLTWV